MAFVQLRKETYSKKQELYFQSQLPPNFEMINKV